MAKIASRKVFPWATVLLAVSLFGLPATVLPQQANGEFRTVTRVVDGDTLLLDNGERVRLIGVDTPETKDPRKPVQFFGQEATAFTQRMAEGKRVWVEYDQANAHLGHRDQYGRKLAYVFLENGKFLNSEIVEQGYGHAYTKYPFKYQNEFRQLEAQARGQKRGLWEGSSQFGATAPSAGLSPGSGIQKQLSTRSTEHAPVSPSLGEGPVVDHSPTGKPIYEGPRGGRYHISESGGKVYHPRTSSGSSGSSSSSRGSSSRGGRR